MLQFSTATPEEVGIESGAILRFLNRLERYQIPMHSIHIMRHDKLVAEGYYSPYAKGQLHRMFSISKSLTSIAICKLQEEGYLSLDDPIIRHFPEYTPENPHPWLASMTIRDMLMMRTCYQNTTYKLDMTKNWVESFFVTPPDHKPGTVFHYDTSAPHTLCALTEKLTGMDMLDYLKEVLLRELGFSEESYLLKDPFGTSLGGSGLMATPEDLLRLGYLLLHKGVLGEKTLLSSDYLSLALTNLTSTAVTGPVISESMGYGYQFWQGQHHSFVCYGMGGQLLICMPDQNLIVVTTADTQGIGGGNQLIYNSLYEELLPALSDTPLPYSSDADRLKDKLTHLSFTPVKQLYPYSGTCAKAEQKELEWLLLQRVHNKTYLFMENPNGFTDLSVQFTEEKGVLTYTLKGHPCHIDFGWNHVLEGYLPVYHMRCAASGMCLDKNTLYIKVHILDTAVGSIHFQLVFGEHDITVFLKKIEESLLEEYQGHLYGEFKE